MKKGVGVKIFGISCIVSLMILIGSFATIIGELRYNTPEINGGDESGNEEGNGTGPGYNDTGENGSGLLPLQVQYTVTSSYSGKVFFTNFSYGRYVNNNWLPAREKYYCAHDELNPLYFTSTALKEHHIQEENITITKYNPTDLSIFPSFVTSGPANNNDYAINFKYPKEYSLKYIPSEAVDLNKIRLSEGYEDVELKYREYCARNYAQVPIKTTQAIASFMDDNGIYLNDFNSIKKVQKLLLNYKVDYNPFASSSGDIAIDFIEGKGKPTTLSYATMGTLIFRMLGYPSRVAGGYSVNLRANEPTIIDYTDHTCWSEIYINGLGWIQVEVSPNIPKMYDDIFFNVENDTTIYKIKPFNLYKKFDGFPLKVKQEIQGLDPFLLKGFTYNCEIEGERTQLGVSYSHIKSFNLFDANNKNVTSLYNFDFDEGIIQVYYQKLYVKTGDITKTYDGTYIYNNHIDIDEYLLKDGHHIKRKKYVTPFKDVGRKINSADVIICDEDDNDITDIYYIVPDFGHIEILPRPLTIKTYGASKVYDGTSLINHNYKCIGLVPDDEINLVINGRQQDIGESLNTISKIQIINKITNTNSINNYNITYDYGILTVNP